MRSVSVHRPRPHAIAVSDVWRVDCRSECLLDDCAYLLKDCWSGGGGGDG